MAESGVFDRDRRQVPVGIAYRTAFGGLRRWSITNAKQALARDGTACKMSLRRENFDA